METTINSLAEQARLILTRSESFSNYLNLETYLGEEGVFILKDGSMAVAYEVELSPHEPMTGQEIETLLFKLKVFFKFKERDVVQFIFEQTLRANTSDKWPKIGDISGYFPDTLKANELARLKGFNNFDRKLIFTVRRLPEKETLGFKIKKLSKEWNEPRSTLEVEITETVRASRELNRDLATLEMGSPLTLTRLNRSQISNIFRSILNPRSSNEKTFAPVQDKRSISDQIVFSESEVSFSGLKREGISSHVMSMKGAPPFCYPGSMAYFLSLNFPFRITINLSFPNEFEIKRHFGL